MKKKVVIALHGFRTDGELDFEPYCRYLKREGITDYKVVNIELYNTRKVETIDWKLWIDNALKAVREHRAPDVEIILAGYSMGAQIALEVARTEKYVKKIIVISPSTYIAWFRIPVSQVMVGIKKMRVYWKHRKRLKRVMALSSHVKPFTIMSEILKSKVTLKKRTSQVEGRTIHIMYGEKDNYIKKGKTLRYLDRMLSDLNDYQVHKVKKAGHIDILHPPSLGEGFKKLDELIKK